MSTPMVVEMVEATRPFHETIVETIHRAGSVEMDCLAALIKATKIPKGHDEIVSAWKFQRQKLGWGDEDLGVPAKLLAEKEVIAKKAEGARVDAKFHYELLREMEILAMLLKDIQPKLVSWNEFFQRQLQCVHKLTSQALGK